MEKKRRRGDEKIELMKLQCKECEESSREQRRHTMTANEVLNRVPVLVPLPSVTTLTYLSTAASFSAVYLAEEQTAHNNINLVKTEQTRGGSEE